MNKELLLNVGDALDEVFGTHVAENVGHGLVCRDEPSIERRLIDSDECMLEESGGVEFNPVTYNGVGVHIAAHPAINDICHSGQIKGIRILTRETLRRERRFGEGGAGNVLTYRDASTFALLLSSSRLAAIIVISKDLALRADRMVSMTEEPKKKRSVLVADDDAVIRRIVGAHLENIGLKVEAVSDGKMAVECVTHGSPDLVFLDIQMPVMDGFAACLEIRELQGDHLPVVMMTGLDDFDSINRAYDAGATDFITKPINWELFKHRTHYLLRAKDTFQAWIKAEARNEAIVSALPDSIARVRPDGTLLDFRPGLGELSVAPSAYGRTISESLPGLAGPQCMYQLERVAATRQPFSIEYQTQVLGKPIDYEARAVPIGEDVLIIFRNISKQKMFARFINQNLSKRPDNNAHLTLAD